MSSQAEVWFAVRWLWDGDQARPDRVIYVRRKGGGPMAMFVGVLAASSLAHRLDELDEAERKVATISNYWLAQPAAGEPSGATHKVMEVAPDEDGRFPVQEGDLFFGVDALGECVTDLYFHKIDAVRSLKEVGYDK